MATAGILRSAFVAAGSAADAVAAARREGGVAWIGVDAATVAGVEDVGRTLGVDERRLAQVVQRRRSPRTPRARVTRLEPGVHVLVLGWTRDVEGGARLQGQLELLAVPGALAVLGHELPDEVAPPALLAAVEASLEQVPATTTGEVLGLVVSAVLDHYERILDALEDETVSVVDELFTRRRGEQLQRISRISRPVHAATVATQPLAHGFGYQVGDPSDFGLGGGFAVPLRAEVVYIAGRLQRVDALLDTAQQTYFNLAQDEANRLMSNQADITRKMSGYALLIAIPTIVFSLYGTNFNHIPLIGESWGYGVMLALTLIGCLVAWRKLRTAGWL
ncbi:MAG TPA: CorA family divalent cation transporter [Baekduia sp.]|jgi:magnesium transporter